MSDVVSDFNVQRENEVLNLRSENDRLRLIIKFLRIGICILGAVGIFCIWFFFYVGEKYGYEEAVKDFTVGKLKCDYIDGKIIWKK